MRSRSFVSLVVLLALVVMSVPVAGAQGNDNPKCQPFIRRALADLGTQCLQLGPNTVCYGHEDVSGLLVEGEVEPADFFAAPGYRAELTSLASVKGSPFVLDESWGLAKLNVQVYTADVENDDPETLEDNMRDILIVGIGDFEIENAEPPAFDENGDLVIDADHHGPMQNFFMRNGHDTPECSDAPPSVMLIQGAEDADTTLIVDGAPLKLVGGDTPAAFPTTLVLFDLPGDEALKLIVLAGMVEVNPNSDPPVRLPPGFFTTLCLDEAQDHGGLDDLENDHLVSCPATEPAQIDEATLDLLKGLQNIPGNILKKPVVPPAVIRASGVGGVVVSLVFNMPGALEQARLACEAGELPIGICNKLFD